MPLVPQRVKVEKHQPFPECVTKPKRSKNGHVFWDINIWDLSFRLLCVSQRLCYHLGHSSMLNTVSSLNMLMPGFPGEVLSHISTDLCPISLLVVLSSACSWKLNFICAVLCERTIGNKMERETLWEEKKLSLHFRDWKYKGHDL